MQNTSDKKINFIEKIHLAYDSSDWQLVIELAQKIDTKSVHFIEIIQLAAIAKYQLDDLIGAIETLQQVIDRDHKNPNLYLNYANFLALSNNLLEAVSYFQKSLNLNPDSAAVHNNLGSVLFDLNQYSESLEHFLKAIKLNPNYFEAHSSAGNVYVYQKQFQQGIKCYEKAYTLEPHNLSLLNNYGLVLMQVGRLELAAEVFLEALAISPTTAELFIPLSAILQTLNKKQQANKILFDGVTTTPWYLSKPLEPKQIHLVTFCGLENAVYDLDNENKVKLNGAHFYTQFLIDEEKFTRYRYHILKKNIEKDKGLPISQLYINTISDPDLELTSLQSLNNHLQQNPSMSIINHPEKVMLTTRDNNYKRLKNITGLIFPKTIRMMIKDNDVAINKIQNEFNYPVLIRKSGTQTGTSFVKILDDDGLHKDIKKFSGKEVYVIEFIDTKFEDEQQNYLYRRFRFFFIENKIYPVTCHIHHSWNVHSIDRSSVMDQQKNLRNKEQLFLKNPKATIGENNFNALSALPESIGLDFFGVDFSLNQNNQVVLFEVNSAMNHSYNYVDTYPYLKPYLDNITEAFHQLIKNKAKTMNAKD